MDSVPNNADSLQTRIDNAKAFLRENPDEKIACAAQIFKLAHTTLYGSISRDKKPISRGQRGGQNKILDEHQVKVIHQFIRSLLAYGIEPSRGVVFNAIVNLKRTQNPENNAPTQRWFRTWWKSNNLHKITTKPLAVVQFTAGQEMDIRAWFVGYRQALGALQIKNEKNIVNFDEAGFRVGCMRGHKILAPVDVLEFYATSPENLKSITIFESIDAAGNYPPPPLILVEGHEIMMDLSLEGLPNGTRIIPSENGVTSDNIAIVFLEHYIEHSDSGPEADWKLMLMDNRESHCTPEFIALANENHIRPYPLIPHLTHCMQPLDVGVFQPYKHWHDMAIQDALLESNIAYTLPRYLGDLPSIRDNTFKESTIRHAFEKSGMWPPSDTKCIQQLKSFSPDIQKKATAKEPTLPALPRI